MSIYLIIFIVIIVVLLIYSLLRSMKNVKHASSNKWPIELISSSGPIHIESSLKHYRPYNRDNPSNYYGIFKLQQNCGYKLTVSSSDYYEVCVYKYPHWDIVYAETNICEIDLDSLPDGEYTVMIHSLDEVKGCLTKTKKRATKCFPEERLHNKGNSHLYDEASQLYDHVTQLHSNLSPDKIDYTSEALTCWPKTMYTREEKLKFHPHCEVTVVIVPKNEYIKIDGEIIAHSENMKAYQLPGNQPYDIRLIYQNINPEDDILPIYAYMYS